MRIKKGFILRNICGENVVSGEGMEQVNFSKLIRLNDTATFLWKSVEGKDFTPESLADLLCEHYSDVTREKALEDSIALCAQLEKNGIAE